MLNLWCGDAMKYIIKLENLYAIEYETLDAVSKVFREDLYNNNNKEVL